MKNAITTIDASGRLVIPKAVREQANLKPGSALVVKYEDGRIEIEPEPVAIRIVRKGPISVAVPAGPIEALRASTVEKVLDEIRRGGPL
jgi:AbrB family looped-hinge helix DNA binding protein